MEVCEFGLDWFNNLFPDGAVKSDIMKAIDSRHDSSDPIQRALRIEWKKKLRAAEENQNGLILPQTPAKPKDD